MTIGLPRALLYYRYPILWRTFFESLGCQVVLSAHMNQQILDEGIRHSIDECCVPAKIFMGHVHALIGRCDYIFVPRVENFGRNESVCVKFNALYDIVKSTFPDAPLLGMNLDVQRGDGERKGFIRIGRQLGAGLRRSLSAYRKAKRAQQSYERLCAQEQDAACSAPGLKILLVAHPYNAYDKMLGYTVIRQIERLGGRVVFADAADSRACTLEAQALSKRLYWTYNKELVGAIKLYADQIDGIVLLTAFPCGPDSLVNELILRSVRHKPIINIVLDELQGEAGLQTRIESFMDIIVSREQTARKAGVLAHG